MWLRTLKGFSLSFSILGWKKNIKIRTVKRRLEGRFTEIVFEAWRHEKKLESFPARDLNSILNVHKPLQRWFSTFLILLHSIKTFNLYKKWRQLTSPLMSTSPIFSQTNQNRVQTIQRNVCKTFSLHLEKNEIIIKSVRKETFSIR
jgi:hypothetical protein